MFFKIFRWSEDKERIEEEYKLVLMEIFSDYLSDMEYEDNLLLVDTKKIPTKKKYVNVFKNMPDELYVDDFSSEEKIDGLLKNKKG